MEGCHRQLQTSHSRETSETQGSHSCETPSLVAAAEGNNPGPFIYPGSDRVLRNRSLVVSECLGCHRQSSHSRETSENQGARSRDTPDLIRCIRMSPRL